MRLSINDKNSPTVLSLKNEPKTILKVIIFGSYVQSC